MFVWNLRLPTLKGYPMIDIMIYAGIAVIVVVVVLWLLSLAKLEEPMATIVKVGAVIFVACIVIGLLLSFGGHSHYLWLPRGP